MTASVPNHDETQAGTEETFFASVYRRLLWIMALEGVGGAAWIWIRYGRISALTFLLGSAVGVINFHWQKRTVEAMAPGKRRSVWVVLLRFFLRYVLIALAAYVIFKGTTNGLYGFFGGLALPVGAILVEAVYETGKSLLNGTLISRN